MATTTPLGTIQSIRKEHDRYNRRWYIATMADGTERRGINVTGVTGVLDKNLVQWGINTGVERLAERVIQYDDGELITFPSDSLPEMVDEAKKRPDAVRDEAADLGTRIHEYIDSVMKGTEAPELKPDMEPSIEAFWQWRNDSGIEVVESEQMVYSLRYDYGGTIDGIARVLSTGEKVILDYKSSKGIYDEMAIQVGGYWGAEAEMSGQAADALCIVRFPKQEPKEGAPPFEVKWVNNPAEAYQCFLRCLGIWKALKHPKREPLWVKS